MAYRVMRTAGLAWPLLACISAAAETQEPLSGRAIPQFVDPLPTLSVAGGPIATVVGGADEIEIHMREFQAGILPSTFDAAEGAYTGTWVWGYVVGPDAPTTTQETYTGPVVVATRNVPTQFRFVNDLGYASDTQVLAWKFSSDQTLHWADPLGDGMNMCAHDSTPMMPPMGECAENYMGPIPAVVHLHGGDVPPVLDGGPDAWFTSDGSHHGPAYYSRPGVSVGGNEAVLRYPNGQEAAPIWFHDHALGVTRLNVYAGLAGAYDIIDPALPLPTGLHPVGLQQGADGPVDYLIPLVIQDRMFDTNGQLYFPAEGINPEHPYWLPEFVGDTIVVNGKVWPYLDVEPRRYRFLFINGSNARTYEMFLTNQVTKVDGPALWQIGTDGGYLDAPVKIWSGLAPIGQLTKLVLMPGERADVIIDFAGQSPGTTLLLRNSAKTPYPNGEAPQGNTVGRILQIRVGPAPDGFVDHSYDPASGIPLRPPLVRLVNPASGTLAPGVTAAQTRSLTLNEVMGRPMPPYEGGPLEVLVNNTKWDGSDRSDFTPIEINGHTTYYSELPREGDTEVWEIVNLTADAHPIHLHLVQFQLMNRQSLDVRRYSAAYEDSFPGGEYLPGYGPPLDYNTGNPHSLGGNPDVTAFLRGPIRPPNPNEAGWKDTILVPPGQVTRFVVRFAPQDKAVNAPDLHYPFDPFALGQGYVWHCHIIDHEDNEMMRPDVVLPEPGAVRTYIQGIDY